MSALYSQAQIKLTDAEIFGIVIGKQRREIAALEAQIDSLIALRKSDLLEKKEMGENIERLEAEMIKMITHTALPNFNTEEQG